MAKDLQQPADGPAQATRRKPPQVTLEQTDAQNLSINGTGAWDRIDLAAGNVSVAEGLAAQLAMLGAPGKRTDADTTNFALGFVDAMQPRDAAELLLLSQMAATHQTMMLCARQLNHVETIPQKDCAEKAMNKTARTFAAQMDTLKRYRSKGKQVVRVERVNVAEGGQAIVGNVEAGGRGNDET